MGYAISRGSMTVIEISIMILIFFFKQITPLIVQFRHPFADVFPDAVLIILTVVSSYGKSV